MNQYKIKPNGPVKYAKTRGIATKPRGILYLQPSLEIQEPKNKLKARK